MTIQPKILLTLLVASLATGYFIWSTYQDHQRTLAAQEWINQTNDAINDLDEVFSSISETESAVRAYAFTGDWVFLDDLHRKINLVQQNTKASAHRLRNDADQHKNIQLLEHLVTHKLQFQQSIVDARKISDTLALQFISSHRGKILMDSLRMQVRLMKDFENTKLNARIERNRELSQTAEYNTFLGGIAAFLFTFVILIRLNRDIGLRKKAEGNALDNEIKYRQLIENSGVVTFTTDFYGRFNFASPQAMELTGYSVEEILGFYFHDLVAKTHVDEVRDFYIEQYKTQTRETTLEFPIITKDGKRKWVEQSCILIIDKEMGTGLQCIVKDITERKEIEEELQRAEESNKAYQQMVRAILDNTPVMMYVKDPEGRYTLVNRKFRETFGLDEEDIIGKTVVDIPGNVMAGVFSEADKRVLATGKPVEFEETIMVGKEKLQILSLKFPLFDQNNKLFGISGISKDITEMVRYREQLISARKKAEQAEKLQEQFLANMSHEIRTPMNGIIGMTNLLAETSLTSQQREFLDLILQSSNTLLVLINDILDLSKIKAGKLSIEKIIFDLPATVKFALNSARVKANEKQLYLNLVVDPAVPVTVSGDPHRLEQILTNLLSNALKFTDKGGVSVNVGVADKQPDRATIAFSVTDTGFGISEDKLEHIFNSFTQAGSDTTRKFGGTGLGLAITRNLVQLQNGRISVSSAMGKGTTFLVEIPYELVHAPAGLSAVPGNHRTRKQTIINKDVLIVEDNEINQKVLYHHLQRLGIVATIANNGKEAVQVLESGQRYDLIIMDLQMPEMNGFQATTYIRKKLACNTPIVAMTASVLRDERKQCFELGMNGYLAKPFAPEELLKMLQQFLPFSQETNSLEEQVESSNAKPPYDLSYLMEMGEQEFIAEVIGMFLENTPAMLSDIRNELIQENWTEVYAMAHRLKSSVGILKIDQMFDELALVEEKSRDKEQVEQVVPLVERLEHHFSLLRPMLEAERDKRIGRLN